MRKLRFLFLFAALSLLTTTTFAQEIKEEVKAVAKEVKAVVKEVQEEKVEIKLSELPEAVTKVLGEEFAEFTAEKAYKTKKENKEVYYIKLSKDGKYKKVLISADGKVIEQKKKEVQY